MSWVETVPGARENEDGRKASGNASAANDKTAPTVHKAVLMNDRVKNDLLMRFQRLGTTIPELTLT